MFSVSPAFRDRFLLDERNLRPLCRLDHRTLDAFLGVLDPQRMPRGTVARLATRFRRHEPTFRAFVHARTRFLAVALRDADRSTADVAASESVNLSR